MSRTKKIRQSFQFAAIAGFAGLIYYFLTRLAAAGDATVASPETKLQLVLLAVANNYVQWGRVDDEMRWAPELCQMPLAARPHFSVSDDATTHGKKLYSLFAQDRAAYLKISQPDSHTRKSSQAQVEIPELRGATQVLVKESWTIEIATEEDRKRLGKIEPNPADQKGIADFETYLKRDHFSCYAEKDGKIFRAEKKAGLYIMIQFDPQQKDTDDGWVYGTVSADGNQVTSAGLVRSCMECHKQAPHSRLFGTAK